MTFPLLITLTGCSGTPLSNLQNDLSSLLNPATLQSPGTENEQTARNQVTKTFSVAVSVDTAAMRLKEHYGFVSDGDVAAARNSGQGNAGWSAAAVSEGSGWSAQPGQYYRMSRNWAGNDRLTLEVSRDGRNCRIIATYISSNPAHLKPAWTARLWKQIPEVAKNLSN